MGQFFKFVTASCLGTLLALGFIMLLFISIGALSTIGANNIPSKSVLKFNITHDIPEKTNNNVVQGQFDFQEFEAIGLHRITELINHAKTDPAIKGLVIEGSQYGIAPAALFSLEEAIRDFKESEKFVYAYGDYFTQQGYFLSSSADSIIVHNMGGVDLRGFAIMIPFFKTFLDKIGVDMNIFYAGDYKSATEPYSRTSMSEYNKQQSRMYLDALSDNFLEQIASNREMSIESLRACINDVCMRNSVDGLEHGFVDLVTDRSTFEDMLRDTLNIKSKKGKINYIDLYEYHSKVDIKKEIDLKNQIAVVYAEGDILYKTDEKGVVSESKYVKIFDQILKNKKIKALVLRVNSPGGSALTSDIIWSKIEEVKASGIPVIASFGDYAASGGYYIACGADTIVAEENTLTGSIGVFMMMPKVKRLMEDKIGINFDTVKTAPLAVALSPFYDLTPLEEEIMENSTDEIYERFLEVVSEGRKQSKQDIHLIAQGRIWSGEQAKTIGLVDELGDLQDAIDIASEMAELESYSTREYPFIKKNPWEEIINEIMKNQDVSVQKIVLADTEKQLLNQYSRIRQMFSYDGPMMRMPFIVQ